MPSRHTFFALVPATTTHKPNAVKPEIKYEFYKTKPKRTMPKIISASRAIATGVVFFSINFFFGFGRRAPPFCLSGRDYFVFCLQRRPRRRNAGADGRARVAGKKKRYQFFTSSAEGERTFCVSRRDPRN